MSCIGPNMDYLSSSLTPQILMPTKVFFILAGKCRAFLASGSEASQTALTRRWVPGAEKPRRIYHEHEQSHLPRKHTQP